MPRPLLKFFTVILLVFFIAATAFVSTAALSKTTVLADDKSKGLPAVGSFENLKSLLAKVNTGAGPGGFNPGMGFRALETKKTGSAPNLAAGAPVGSGQPADYSSTNLQVQGVDEADIVKTDGEYIYQVNKQRVIICKAYPAEKMKVADSIDFSGEQFSPQEIYIDNRYLVVIGSTSGRYYTAQGGPELSPGNPQAAPKLYPPPAWRSTVKAIVYDIRDKAKIKYLREIELDGDYLSSRKVGSALYLVANKYIPYFQPTEASKETLLPFYRDTALGDKFNEIDCGKIYYFPGFVEPNYLVVAGIDLSQPQEAAHVSAYLGSGENIYASSDNLYVAVNGYDRPSPENSGIVPSGEGIAKVYKFALDNGTVKYAADGAVPGHILNQFSLDENQGYLRMATTSGDVWRSGESTAKNNIYILDANLKMVGKLENIAPGEKIYSARFIGDRGYLVTFRTVDPLFVLDLKDPKNPKILGALKIPGYSDYLHPYDENHLIGFGKDTVEMAQKDPQGNTVGNMAYYLGMKMAIFDVTDPAKPVQMFTAKIGDRGTDSELLHNHKALLFSKEKKLLAFPVTVTKVTNSEAQSNSGGTPAYGAFVFQGAYIYKIDLEHGFILKGRITHLTGDDYAKAGEDWYDSDKNINRILYIKDTLYTLSNSEVRANALTDLSERGAIKLP